MLTFINYMTNGKSCLLWTQNENTAHLVQVVKMEVEWANSNEGTLWKDTTPQPIIIYELLWDMEYWITGSFVNIWGLSLPFERTLCKGLGAQKGLIKYLFLSE